LSHLPKARNSSEQHPKDSPQIRKLDKKEEQLQLKFICVD